MTTEMMLREDRDNIVGERERIFEKKRGANETEIDQSN